MPYMAYAFPLVATIASMYFVTVCTLMISLWGVIVNRVSLIIITILCIFIFQVVAWVNVARGSKWLLYCFRYFVDLVYNVDYVYARGASPQWPSLPWLDF